MFLFGLVWKQITAIINFIYIQTKTFENMFNVTSWTEFEKLKSLQIDNLLV